MDFAFLSPKIMVKRGGAAEAGALCAPYMRRVGVFRYGARFEESGARERVEASLSAAGLEAFFLPPTPGEPSAGVVNAAAAMLREYGCDGVLAIGGGSVTDAAKAAAALAPNGTDIMDYVEGFDPQPFENEPLPCVAFPTTAGTGSECTKNSVITVKGSFKNSVRADGMLPRLAVVDAELMLGVPPRVTAEAGADAVCHLVECFTTKFSNPLSDAVALAFAKQAFAALPRAYQNGRDIDAREQMGICALAGGLAMSNAGLGMAHGLAAGLGAMTPLTHGLACGVALPFVMRFNIEKGAVSRYARLAREVGGRSYPDEKTAALDFARMTGELMAQIGMPRDFKGRGLSGGVEKIAAASMGSSMGKNPVPVSLAECGAVLGEIL